MFTEMYSAINDGRLKIPPLAVLGNTGSDLLREEMAIFDHDATSKWFGSPEKNRRGGIQDDAMYSLGGAVFAGRGLSTVDFKERKPKINFGIFIPPYERPLGVYH
jgi:hypothetical protein